MKFRDRIRRWLGIEPELKEPKAEKRPFVISDVAVARARLKVREHQVIPLALPSLPPGVLPDAAKLAMDEAFSNVQSWANSYLESYASEGLAFPGYPILAEMAQRPEYRRIVETIAEEATRRWIKVSAIGDDDKSDKIATINAALVRLRVKDVFREAAEHDGFFGRAHIYLDFGVKSGDPEQLTPIGDGHDKVSQAKVAKGSLKFLRTIEPVWCGPIDYSATDPLADNWYRPQAWYVQGRQIHATRFLTLVGRKVPDLLKPSYMFGGLSMSQMARPYVNNWLDTRQAVADLIKSFSVSGLKTDLAGALGLGGTGEGLMNRVTLFNALRDNRGTMVLNKGVGPDDPGEEFFNVSTPLGTLDVLQAQTQEHMASVSGIPLVKLLGISPAGLNSTSEGEIRVFYDHIHAYQELLFRSPIQSILGFIQLSEFGQVDPDITFNFEPLWSMDEKERAEVDKTKADTDQVRIDSGVILASEARQRVAADPDTPYAGLDPELDIDPPGGGELDDVPEPNKGTEQTDLENKPAKPPVKVAA